MDKANYWMWLVKTKKGNFLISVIGKWTQEEAAVRVKGVFKVLLKVDILDMIPRKLTTGPADMQGTIYEQDPPTDELGFTFHAGKKIWDLRGQGAKFDAIMKIRG